MSVEDATVTELSMLLYVSESMIPPERASAELAIIVDRAKQKNSVLGITGSLVFTGDHFAQLLEGPSKDLEALMASIRRDPRHTNTIVCIDRRISTRRFAKWALAYAGPSQYIAQRVTAAIVTDPSSLSGPSADGLLALMKEFAEHAKDTAA